jgi:hypothetical protein
MLPVTVSTAYHFYRGHPFLCHELQNVMFTASVNHNYIYIYMCVCVCVLCLTSNVINLMFM